MNQLDSFDRRILGELQKDGSLGPADLSERIHLSASQCSRRIQRLKAEGYIDRISAVVNRKRVNLKVSALALVRLESHTAENERAFTEAVQSFPEIIACHYVTGDVDFILHIVTRDLESYNEFLRRKLLPSAAIVSCRSNIIMGSLKDTTTVSLEFV